MSPAAATRMVAVTGRLIPAGGVPRTPKRGRNHRLMSSQTRENQHALIATMKRSAAALRDAEIEFMLGGGLAAWARGGPPTEHDVDFYLREEDAENALMALAAAGMRTERPPEEWLFKAYDGPILVDLSSGRQEGRSETNTSSGRRKWRWARRQCSSQSIDDVLVTKLLALSEQEPELPARYRAGASAARAIRLGGGPFSFGRVPVRTRIFHAGGRTRHRRVRKLPPSMTILPGSPTEAPEPEAFSFPSHESS